MKLEFTPETQALAASTAPTAKEPRKLEFTPEAAKLAAATGTPTRGVGTIGNSGALPPGAQAGIIPSASASGEARKPYTIDTE